MGAAKSRKKAKKTKTKGGASKKTEAKKPEMEEDGLPRKEDYENYQSWISDRDAAIARRKELKKKHQDVSEERQKVEESGDAAWNRKRGSPKRKRSKNRRKPVEHVVNMGRNELKDRNGNWRKDE